MFAHRFYSIVSLTLFPIYLYGIIVLQYVIFSNLYLPSLSLEYSLNQLYLELAAVVETYAWNTGSEGRNKGFLLLYYCCLKSASVPACSCPSDYFSNHLNIFKSPAQFGGNSYFLSYFFSLSQTSVILSWVSAVFSLTPIFSASGFATGACNSYQNTNCFFFVCFDSFLNNVSSVSKQFTGHSLWG